MKIPSASSVDDTQSQDIELVRNEISDWFRTLFRSAGLSQRDVARKLGMHQPSLSRSVSLKRAWKPGEIIELSKTINVSTDEIRRRVAEANRRIKAIETGVFPPETQIGLLDSTTSTDETRPPVNELGYQLFLKPGSMANGLLHQLETPRQISSEKAEKYQKIAEAYGVQYYQLAFAQEEPANEHGWGAFGILPGVTAILGAPTSIEEIPVGSLAIINYEFEDLTDTPDTLNSVERPWRQGSISEQTLIYGDHLKSRSFSESEAGSIVETEIDPALDPLHIFQNFRGKAQLVRIDSTPNILKGSRFTRVDGLSFSALISTAKPLISLAL